MKTNSDKTETSEAGGGGTRRRSVGSMLLRIVGLFLVTATLSFPWWSPWVVAQVIRSFGGEVGYARPSGFQRMELRDLKLDLPSVHITAARIQAYNPLGWGLALLGRDAGRPFVDIRDIAVVLQPSDAEAIPRERDASEGMVAVFEQVGSILRLVDRWAPIVELQNARFSGFGDQRLLTVHLLEWKERVLSAEAVYSDESSGEKRLDLRAAMGSEVWTVRLGMPEQALIVAMDLNLEASEKLQLNGELVWLENRFVFQGEWGREGWLPLTAGIDRGQWAVRRGHGLESMPWEELRVEGGVLWEHARASLDLKGVVQAPENWPKRLREVAFSLQAHADLDQMVLKELDVTSGGVALKLEEPLLYEYETGWKSGSIQADAAIPLEGWGVETLSGTLYGTLRAVLGGNDPGYKVWFALTGGDVAWDGWASAQTSLSGWVDREQVAITELKLTSELGSSLSGEGSYSWAGKAWGPTQASLQWSGEPLPLALQQEQFTPGAFDLQVTLEGPRGSARHAGSLLLRGWEFPEVYPLDAAILWEGEGINHWSDVVLSVKSEEGGSLDVKGNVLQEDDGGWRVSLSEMQLEGLADVAPLTLQQSTELHVVRTGEEGGPDLRLSPLVLTGGPTHIAVAGSFQSLQRCSWDIEVREVDAANWASLWKKTNLPEITVTQVISKGSVQGGTLLQESHLALAWSQADRRWWMRGDISVLDEELRIDSLEVQHDQLEGPWLDLEAKLPFQIQLEDGVSPVTLTESQNMELRLRMPKIDQNLPMPGWVLPSMLTSADLELILNGTVSQPEGSARIAFATRTGVGDRERIVSQWTAELAMNGREVQIHRLQAVSGDATMVAQGSVLLPSEVLGILSLQDGPIPWDQTQVRIVIDDADLLPLTALFPQILRPSGVLSAEFGGSLKEGFAGSAHLRGLSTAPIFPFGAVRDLEAKIQFSDQKAELLTLTSKIGRETLHGEGWYSWGDSGGHGFDFGFSGEGIPVVRQAGILLRTDLDLKASQAPGGVPSIGGMVNLRDGVFLLDLTVLLQGGSGARSVKSRPPYFSVEEPPFRDWNLDLQVTGDQFMRVRTPIVDGLLSADLRLVGTLGEPLVHGSLTFDEGWVKFPFASFEVERGMVRLDRANPFNPTVELTGTASRLDYRLQLDVAGQADQPEVRFTSSPPLDSERILLMVLAGEDPSGTIHYSATQRASKIGTYLAQGFFSGTESGDANWVNRLNISWGDKLSQSGRETMDASFRLNRTITVVGEYDEYDEWNGGLRWRILPRVREETDASVGGEP